MSSKIQRKVTVENVKDSADAPRRPSVFERLGPGAVGAQERHSRTSDPGEKCRNWMRSGICSYGSKCRYQHEAYPPSSSSSKAPKAEREPSQKDLRHKVRHKQQDARESRSRSPSPKKRKLSSGGGSNSRTRRSDTEGKIKSTVVVTRPRTPSSGEEEQRPPKDTKPPKNWEGASDDWPLDEASLDYKEELSLEMKRQQLQRELEMLQKENRPGAGAAGGSSATAGGGHVTITKTVHATHSHQVPFSESSESSSDSDSSSSDSSSSSSDDDSDDTTSSSSSGAASPTAVRTGTTTTSLAAAAGPSSTPERVPSRHRRRGTDERSGGRRVAIDPPPAAPPPPKGRELPRSSTLSHTRGSHRDSARHGRERQAAGRDGGEGRSPPPRRRQDPDYDAYARSRGPRTPSPGAASDARRKMPTKQTAQAVQLKTRKKKKSSKRRRERERQLKAQHRAGTRISGQPPLGQPSRDSVSPELPPAVRSSGHSTRDALRRNREREVPSRAADTARHGPLRARSPPPPLSHDSLTPPHLHRSIGDKYSAPPPKRQRRESPPLDEPPPREPRKKETERHGREEHGSHSKGGYDSRYLAESESRGHQGGRKREDSYPEPPPVSHRSRHEPVDDDGLEPGEVIPDQGDRYGGERGGHSGGRSRDIRRTDYHRSRSTSPSMSSIPRSRLEVDAHRGGDYPHSPQGGRSRAPEPSKSKGDQRISDSRRDTYPRGPPEGRGDSYRRQDIRSDPHKRDGRSDGRPDYHERSGSRPDYHGRAEPKSDYHRGDPYAKGTDGRSEREPRGDPYSRNDVRGDSYRQSDYRHERGDPQTRMDARSKESSRIDRGELPYEPRPEGYGRGEDYYGRPADPKLERGRDYYGDGYGSHRSEPRDRGLREGRRPEHTSRTEVHSKGGMRMERERRSDTRGGERPPERRSDMDGRMDSRLDDRLDGRMDGRPSAYGSKSDHGDSRGRGGSRGEDMRDSYDRGDGYRGDRPDLHRGPDSRGESSRRDHKRPPRMDLASEESSSSRYGRRDEGQADARERDSRMTSREGRGGGRSRSSSPGRSYERKRTSHKERVVKQESIKREEETSSRDADVKEETSSSGSRGSSPRRPQEKTSSRTSRDPAPERREQSPDTSVPEVVPKVVEAASPLTEDSEEDSPAKGEVSDSSKHMVLVEECKSEDENDNAQEQKPGASETFSDWSDDEDDILTRDDPTLEFVVKEPSSDGHHDQVSQDKLEEATEANLIEVDAVPISPAESHHSGEEGIGAAEEFDPISDDELEALIDESKEKEPNQEKAAVSDALDIDWSSLVKEARPKEEATAKRGSARERYSGARVFARIGISRDLAGKELTEQVVDFCRKELGGDQASENGESEFKLEDLTAGFHVAAVTARHQQMQALRCCGRYSRALSARRDLMLRRALCKVYEPSTTTSAAAATRVNPELYKRSLQLFQSRVSQEVSQEC